MERGVGVKRIARGTRRNPSCLTTMGMYTECRSAPTGSYRIRDDGKKGVCRIGGWNDNQSVIKITRKLQYFDSRQNRDKPPCPIPTIPILFNASIKYPGDRDDIKMTWDKEWIDVSEMVDPIPRPVDRGTGFVFDGLEEVYSAIPPIPTCLLIPSYSHTARQVEISGGDCCNEEDDSMDGTIGCKINKKR